MNCPRCKSSYIKIDVMERNFGTIYYYEDDYQDTKNFDCMDTWLIKQSAFQCMDCSLEDNIKYLEGKLPYEVKSHGGDRFLKFKQVKWKNKEGDAWKKNQDQKKSLSSATAST